MPYAIRIITHSSWFPLLVCYRVQLGAELWSWVKNVAVDYTLDDRVL